MSKALIALFVLGACNNGTSDAQKAAPASTRQDLSREPIQPLPPPPAADPGILSLGRKLFHDRRLSADETVSCSSCHDASHGGADGRALSIGVHGALGEVNAPTVFNAGLNFVQFWDGRSPTLEDQVDKPLTSPIEMGSSWDAVLPKLAKDDDYRTRFDAVFHAKPTAESVRTAIATFERSLETVDSPFDRWLKGDKTALTADQVKGYDTFKSVGCIACHQGRNVGGNMFQRFGIFGDYFADRGHVTKADYGRFNVTNQEADRFVFRVPSLRHAARTAPYFHDGSAAKLPDAVQIMARYQLGRELSSEQLASIVAFIGALEGSEPREIE